jgi:HK97 family phage portal protein
MVTRKLKKKPKRKLATLAPDTTLQEPQQRAAGIWLVPARTGGVVVNEDTALTLGAVFACVRVISESLAGLPWFVFERRRDGGLNKRADHDVSWLLDVQANPETPAFQWRETLVAHALTWGNGYAEIERDFAGRPVWLWQITPDRVCPERATLDVIREHGLAADGVRVNDIVYRVDNYRSSPTYLAASNMYHLRGLGFDGLVGYSVIRLAARSIGLGMSLDDSAASFFANDSTPGGLLIHPSKLSETARQNLISTWEKRHKGPKNQRRVAVIEEAMQWQATGIPAKDAQFVEQKGLTPADICRWFRVPPHKIADLTRSTNNNIEHQSIEFVNDTLRPWAERQESEADIKLFGRTNRGQLVTVIDLNELKRGDTAAQTAFIKELSDRGILDVDEGREYIGKNPIGPAEGGDKRFVQMNMQLLKTAGDVLPGEEPDEPTLTIDERMAIELACEPILQDACRRIIKRQSDAKHLEGNALGQWLGKHREFCRDTLAPPVRLLAQLRSRQPDVAATTSITSFIDRYLTCSEPLDHIQQAKRLYTMVIAACAATDAHKENGHA